MTWEAPVRDQRETSADPRETAVDLRAAQERLPKQVWTIVRKPRA